MKSKKSFLFTVEIDGPHCDGGSRRSRRGGSGGVASSLKERDQHRLTKSNTFFRSHSVGSDGDAVGRLLDDAVGEQQIDALIARHRLAVGQTQTQMSEI